MSLKDREKCGDCPYDPQQVLFEVVLMHLIKAAQVIVSAPYGIGAHLDLAYWKGVASAREARIYPSIQPGAVVTRKVGTSPSPFVSQVLRFDLCITDDNPKKVVRVFYMGMEGWCLQLEGEQGRIFPEDQFDLVTYSGA